VDALARSGALTPGTTADPTQSHRRGDVALSHHPDAACPSAVGACGACGSARAAACPALRAVEAALAAAGAALGAEAAARGRVRGPLRHTQTQVALFRATHTPPGRCAGFARHTDVTPTSPRRVLTLIAYLNDPRWRVADAGGALRVFAPPVGHSGAPVAELAPAGGTVVALRSGVEHEVAPAHAARAALTCWLEEEEAA
jgi:hypothetical protein